MSLSLVVIAIERFEPPEYVSWGKKVVLRPESLRLQTPVELSTRWIVRKNTRADAMLVACRLAGLSALEADYAGVMMLAQCGAKACVRSPRSVARRAEIARAVEKGN